MGQLASPLQAGWILSALARRLSALGVSIPHSTDAIQHLHVQRRLLLKEAEEEGFRPFSGGHVLSGCPAICFGTHSDICTRMGAVAARDLPPFKKARTGPAEPASRRLPAAPDRPGRSKLIAFSDRMGASGALSVEITASRTTEALPGPGPGFPLGCRTIADSVQEDALVGLRPHLPSGFVDVSSACARLSSDASACVPLKIDQNFNEGSQACSSSLAPLRFRPSPHGPSPMDAKVAGAVTGGLPRPFPLGFSPPNPRLESHCRHGSTCVESKGSDQGSAFAELHGCHRVAPSDAQPAHSVPLPGTHALTFPPSPLGFRPPSPVSSGLERPNGEDATILLNEGPNGQLSQQIASEKEKTPQVAQTPVCTLTTLGLGQKRFTGVLFEPSDTQIREFSSHLAETSSPIEVCSSSDGSDSSHPHPIGFRAPNPRFEMHGSQESPCAGTLGCGDSCLARQETVADHAPLFAQVDSSWARPGSLGRLLQCPVLGSLPFLLPSRTG